MLKRYMNSATLFMADKDENDFSAQLLLNRQRNTYAMFRQREYNLAI